MNSRFHWCAPAQVGEPTFGERAQEVERRGGLVVAAHHALRVGTARRGLELEVVDDVAEERRQLEAVALLGRRRAGLGELPGDAPDLERRNARAVREHERHLQDHLELVADVVGRELGERLRAVAGVEQEALALRDACERRAERACLAREHERRHRPQFAERAVELVGVGPRGLLRGGVTLPAGGLPLEVGKRLRRGHSEITASGITGTRRADGCPVRARAAGASLRTAAAPASAA